MDVNRYGFLTILLIGFGGLGELARAGVYSHYSFDSDYQDSSGNGRHGTLVDTAPTGNSGITTIAGEYQFGGGGMEFSADRDYVGLPSKTFTSGVPYSIAFWAKRDSASHAWDMVIGQRDTGNFFIALQTGNNMRWRSSSSAGERQADFAVTSDTNWHHYVIAADNSQNITLYLDGNHFDTDTGNQTGFILDTIGEAYTSGSDLDFVGQIDEVWVFDETITATEVTNLFTYNNTSPPAEAVLTYRFDGDFSDSSSSTNDGGASGTAEITTATNRVAVGTGALQLDGSADAYVMLSTSIVFSADDAWSVTFWAQRAESGGQKSMVLGERNTTDDFIWLNDNFNGLRFKSSTAKTFDFTVAQDLDLHHYALVANGTGGLSLYLDGSPVQSLSGNTSFTIDTVGMAYTGTSLQYFGILDEMRVYQGSLTGSEVLALYRERTRPPSPVVTRLRVFLQAGQSNADGRATPGELPTTPVDLQQPQSDIDFYYKVQGGSGTLTTLRPGRSESSQFGPEVTFGHDLNSMLNLDATTRVALIKYANGGTRLATQWKAGGDATTTGDLSEYLTFQQTVTAGMAALAAAYTGAVIEIEGMIWHQGESDTSSGAYANAYVTNLAEFISDVRATYGADLPFVIGRLSDLQTALNATHLETVRAAQTALAADDPFTGLVDTDPFALKTDNLHYNATGQQAMGSAFARQIGYQLWMQGLFTPAQLAAGETEPGGDADSDGMSNDDEFIAGTLPDEAESLLRTELRLKGADTFEIRYPGAADRLFAVEAKTNLATTAWTNLLPRESGNGGTVSRALTNSTPQRFMRVRATLP